MTQPPVPPLHSQRRRLGPLDYVIAALGVWFTGTAIVNTELVSIVLLIVVVGAILYTTEWRYDLYSDTLVVRYILYRSTLVPLGDLDQVRLVSSGFLGRGILLQRSSGKRTFIRPIDLDEFHRHLTDVRREPSPGGPGN